MCLQGEEGPQGPPGEAGDKGDKVGYSSMLLPLSLHFFSQSLNEDSDPDVHCKYTKAGLVILYRATEVSRAHRVRLAKRERM